MNKKLEQLKAGILGENPIFVMLLGLCPVLGTSESLNKAFGMSLAVIFVLLVSNIIISLIKKLVPSEVRIPVYIVIIATIVTIVDVLLKTFVPALSLSLGAFIPLITVNCIILGRAEAFASKNTVVDSIFDALAMGSGFAVALISLSFFRELLATGGWRIENPFDPSRFVSFLPLEAIKIPLIGTNMGAFLILGLMIGIINTIKISQTQKRILKNKEVVR